MSLWKKSKVRLYSARDSSFDEFSFINVEEELAFVYILQQVDFCYQQKFLIFLKLTAVVFDDLLLRFVSEDRSTAKGNRWVISQFIHQLFHPKYRYIRDLYPFMFLLDVLCFFIIVFGFSSFGYGGSGSVVKDIQVTFMMIFPQDKL